MKRFMTDSSAKVTSPLNDAATFARACALYRNGDNTAEIAAALHVSEAEVYNAVFGIGIWRNTLTLRKRRGQPLLHGGQP